MQEYPGLDLRRYQTNIQCQHYFALPRKIDDEAVLTKIEFTLVDQSSLPTRHD